MVPKVINYILNKGAFVFSLSKALIVFILVNSRIVALINIFLHSPPKPHAFVSLPLKSFSVSFNLRVNNDNTNIKGSQDKVDLDILLDKNNKGEAYNDEDEERIVRLKKEYPMAFDREDNASSGEILTELKEYIEDISGEKVEVGIWKEGEKDSMQVDYSMDRAIEGVVRSGLRNNSPDTVLRAIKDFEPQNSLEADAKARLLWTVTHPPIPEADWNNTTQTTVSKAYSESTLAKTDSDPASQSYKSSYQSPSQSSESPSQSSLPVNTSGATTSSLTASTTDTSPNIEKFSVKKESPMDFVADKMECEMPNYTEPED